ncbi:hypothetical protein HHI36_008743, partial [Cryptolaemus montrouzieri]
MSLLAQLKEKRHSLKSIQTTIVYPDGRCYIECRSSALPVETINRPYGYVVDNKPDDKPAKILNHLYLGSQDCCKKEILEEHHITNVLSVGIQAPCVYDGITYHFLNCLDLPETNIWEIIKNSVSVIRNSVMKCENILVHCNAGVSRSASIVIGYLILEQKFDYVDAFDYVHSIRPCIKPNEGFLKQLRNTIFIF